MPSNSGPTASGTPEKIVESSAKVPIDPHAYCKSLAAEMKQIQEDIANLEKQLKSGTTPAQKEQLMKAIEAENSALSGLRKDWHENGCDQLPPGPIVEPPDPIVVDAGMYCKQTLTDWGADFWKKASSRELSAIGRPIRVDGFTTWFERGVLYSTYGWSAKAKAPPTVVGEIYKCYMQHGGPGGWLGTPAYPIEPVGPFSTQRFGGGRIVLGPAAPKALTYGQLEWFWFVHNATLGPPMTEILEVKPDGVLRGWLLRCANGVAYNNQSINQPNFIPSPWLQFYEQQCGGAAGPLGFPLTGLLRSAVKQNYYIQCEHGIILWPSSTPATLEGVNRDGVVLFAVSLFIERCEAHGEETPFGGPDLYLEVSEYANGQQELNAYKLPVDEESYELGGPVGFSGPTHLVVPTLAIHVDVRGRDHKDIGEDGDYGTFSDDFTIENGWGFLPGYNSVHDNSDFMVDFRLRQPPRPWDPRLGFRQQWFWQFHNFDTDTLSQATCSETFSDIGADDNWLLHPFNKLFYTLFYKGLASGGNCFGMCLASIQSQFGATLFSEPVYQYGHPDTNKHPTDPGVIEDINIYHGYQAGRSSYLYFIDNFLSGGAHSPRQVFADSLAQYNAGDYPIINVTSSLLGGEGHAVRPYRWEPTDPSDPLHQNEWYIYIANPNAPWNIPDDDPRCRIRIDQQDNWSLEVGKGEVWSGSSSSGGWIWSVPFHVLAERPTSIALWIELALAALLAGGMIIIGEDGKASQITDEQSRNFYTRTMPTRWDEIIPNSIPDFARLPLLAGTGASPEIYYKRAAGGDLTFAISTPNGGNVSVGFLSVPIAATISTTVASGSLDAFKISGVGSDGQQIRYSVGLGQGPKQLSATFRSFQGTEIQHSMTVQERSGFTAYFTDCGRTLHLIPSGQSLVTTFSAPKMGSGVKTITAETRFE